MRKLLTGVSVAAITLGVQTPAQAQVAEIVVTATKRAENAQDIPVTVQAMGSEQLKQLRVEQFTDYLTQMPSVTSGGGGPGQSTIYIRGVASTTPNLLTAGVAGLAPNVALYLDEQPLSQPGRNLDVYATDLERIEVLAGPQGTLFGASSQAGTVRLITNKPKIGRYEMFANGGVSTTEGGKASYKIEGGVNVPVGDHAALRVIGFYDQRGGYIDNVRATQTVAKSARFVPAGARRPNGTIVNPLQQGLQPNADLSRVNLIAADNAALVENNINDSNYAGFRAGAKAELGPDWDVNVGYMKQWINSDGVFFDDPNLGEYKIARFDKDRLDDDFDNVNWTINGRIGALELVYTGAFTQRKTKQRIDYADYLFSAQYFPYYICDSTVSYPGYNASYGGTAGVPFGTCQAPNAYVTSNSKTRTFTNEFRVTTPKENRFRVTAGAFQSDLRLDERNDFAYPGNKFANHFGGLGFAPNRPATSNTNPKGYFSDPGPFPADVLFRNDVRRTDKQWGVFGEASYDLIPDKLTFTAGARYYDVKVGLAGSADSSFCTGGGSVDKDAFGANLSDIFDGDGKLRYNQTCGAALGTIFTLSQTVDQIQAVTGNRNRALAVYNALRAPTKARTKGAIVKANLSYKPTDDVMVYMTYSEGYRPGLLNRPGGRTNGTFTVPFVVDTDELTNYELGWKTNLADNQFQFNGSIFYDRIRNLQTTIYDPNITNLFFSANAANARVYGLESDFIVAPRSIPGLTIAGAASFLNSKITKVLLPTNDVVAGKPLAFAPKFQGNIRARYEFGLSDGLKGFVMPQFTHAGSSRSDILEFTATKVASWQKVDFSAGLVADHWGLDIFVENLNGSHGPLSATALNGPIRQVPLRPRTIGLRLSFKQ
ncbi:TonB-dependent receptor [Novosphingobium sp. CCH12-A3]|uniref:TonB-dependent receptor n=1 Tax=Novosphingobium sp. CCH12-A3 TaxID=1768752 RepID=UPI000783433D|nr:TonB-dependent receptor [Novosphingobium sp. CCH12-A3]